MDNYKIKVNDEAESKEAQELLKQLGFQEEGFTGIGLPCYLATWDGGYADYYFGSLSEGRKREELTLPQLRDLVVLKRNDVKDATHEDQYGDKWLYLDERHYVYLNDQWDLPIGEFLERYELKPILPVKKQDPALISGDVALANVHKCIVQYLHDDEPYGRWTTITDHLWSQYHLGMFLDPDTKFKFRFKPQTIKLELELPKPFEPEEDCHVYILDDGKTDGYRRYSYEVHGDKGNTFIGIWRTEDEIKQVVEQLRKIRGAS
ncbi:hypothetical protein [Acinetobacter baumannii]|uniref:hypothetical protein n=1 Tax=Acinetobacter baumannii TaxID=470 RepID=UPI000DA69480|nr:hypothetical protein [Acinetobacter baumannii]